MGATKQDMLDILTDRGVRDARVLDAFAQVPRELFVPAAWVGRTYEDTPLPIGHGQTISQPYCVAKMVELTAPQVSDRALEIGAGCGYAAAILGRVARSVTAVEIRPELADQARTNVAAAGADNVDVRLGDGSFGCAEHSPYDVIIVSAGLPTPDVPGALRQQLADGGRLVAPVRGPPESVLARAVRRLRRLPAPLVLIRLVRRGDNFERTEHGPVGFVPFVGAAGRGRV